MAKRKEKTISLSTKLGFNEDVLRQQTPRLATRITELATMAEGWIALISSNPFSRSCSKIRRLPCVSFSEATPTNAARTPAR